MSYNNRQNGERKHFKTISEEYPVLNSVSADDVTIIIPTHNEEEAISLVIEDTLINGYEKILVVDGTSTDRTVEITKKHGINIVYRESGGKGSAIKTALQKIDTPYFVLIDGDCTYKTEDVEKLLKIYDDNMEVIGIRSQGRDNITLFNRFGNWLINNLFNLIFNSNLQDVCSGMYLLQTKVAKNLDLQATGFDIEVEIAAKVASQGKIAQTPIGYYPRKGSRKLNSLRDGFIIITKILLLGFQLKRNRMCYLGASSLVLPGVVLSLFPFYFNILNRNLNSFVVGLTLILIAFQGFTLLLVDSKMSKWNS